MDRATVLSLILGRDSPSQIGARVHRDRMRHWLRNRNERREQVLDNYYMKNNKVGVKTVSGTVKRSCESSSTTQLRVIGKTPSKEERLRALPASYRSAETSAYLNSLSGSSKMDEEVNDDNITNETRLREMKVHRNKKTSNGKKRWCNKKQTNSNSKHAPCNPKLTSVPLNAALAMSVSMTSQPGNSHGTSEFNSANLEDELGNDGCWINDGYVFEKVGTMYPDTRE